jgi:hypothetical protein
VSDLTKVEQENVRVALRVLRGRHGAKMVGRLLRAAPEYLRTLHAGHGEVTASLAVRVARLAEVGVDDVLTGRFPPAGVCRHCGHGSS